MMPPRLRETASKRVAIPARNLAAELIQGTPRVQSSSQSATSPYWTHPPSPKRQKTETPRFQIREGDSIADFVHYVKQVLRKELGPRVHYAYIMDGVIKALPPRPEWREALEKYSDIRLVGRPNLQKFAIGSSWTIHLDMLVEDLENWSTWHERVKVATPLKKRELPLDIPHSESTDTDPLVPPIGVENAPINIDSDSEEELEEDLGGEGQDEGEEEEEDEEEEDPEEDSNADFSDDWIL